MPNWCSNHVYIVVKNDIASKSFIEKLTEAHDAGTLNKFLIKTNNSREDNIDKWGTKWDIDPTHQDFSYENNGSTIDCNLSYRTAWSPNVPATNILYKRLKELDPDATMEHYYDEPGCAFYGISDGETDNAYEMDVIWSIKEEACEHLRLKRKENNNIYVHDICYQMLIALSSKAYN